LFYAAKAKNPLFVSFGRKTLCHYYLKIQLAFHNGSWSVCIPFCLTKIISSAHFGLGKGIAAQHCCCEKMRSKEMGS
jgi:hypothetical protein